MFVFSALQDLRVIADSQDSATDGISGKHQLYTLGSDTRVDRELENGWTSACAMRMPILQERLVREDSQMTSHFDVDYWDSMLKGPSSGSSAAAIPEADPVCVSEPAVSPAGKAVISSVSSASHPAQAARHMLCTSCFFSDLEQSLLVPLEASVIWCGNVTGSDAPDSAAGSHDGRCPPSPALERVAERLESAAALSPHVHPDLQEVRRSPRVASLLRPGVPQSNTQYCSTCPPL